MKKISLTTLFLLLILGTSNAFTQMNTRKAVEVDPSEKELLSRLQNGESAFFIRAFAYKTKKGFDPETQKTYPTFDEFIQNETSKASIPYTYWLNYLAHGSTKEKRLKVKRKTQAFMLIGQPGSYTLSRLMMAEGYSIGSTRLFKKMALQPGKILYVGDVIFLTGKKMRFDTEIVFQYRPESAQEFMETYYPNLQNALITEDVFSKPSDEGQ